MCVHALCAEHMLENLQIHRLWIPSWKDLWKPGDQPLTFRGTL